MGTDLSPLPPSSSASLIPLEVKKCPPEGGALVKSASCRPLFKRKELTPAQILEIDESYRILTEMAYCSWTGELPKHQLRFCSRAAVPAEINRGGEIIKTGMPGTINIMRLVEDEQAHYSYFGLARCASPLTCPVCSRKVAPMRAAEIQAGAEWMIKAGYSPGMVTQTAAHTVRGSFYDFVQRFQAANNDLKESRAYKAWKKDVGLFGYIRAVESTFDAPWSTRRTGGHFHGHQLNFFSRRFTEVDAVDAGRMFTDLHIKSLRGVGLNGSVEHAARVDLPRLTEDQEKAAKGDAQKIGAYIAKNCSIEVAGGRFKKGRSENKHEDRRITQWQLMSLATKEYPELMPVLRDYMIGIKGRNWLKWSPGLKQFCGIPELSDAQLLEGGGDENIYSILDEEFYYVARMSAQGKLLRKAKAEGVEGVRSGLEAARRNCDMFTGEEVEL